jgi:hypothetical protein
VRDALALLEAVFMDREAAFAAVRPPPLLPLRNLDADVFVGLLLREDAALFFETLFFEALFFEALFFEALFFDAPVLFAAGRPRVLAPLRAFDVPFFADLAIRNSFDLSPARGRVRPRKQAVVNASILRAAVSHRGSPWASARRH